MKFQNCILTNFVTDAQTSHTQAICPFNFSKVGGIKKKEKIQERAFSLSIEIMTSYESLLMKSQLPSLKVRRLRAIALEAFKILNNLSPVYLNDLLTF